jgi:hypothetical protein
MSTKKSIYLDDDFHLYTDALDNEHVYLALEKASGAVAEMVIKIPMTTWKNMQERMPEKSPTHD